MSRIAAVIILVALGVGTVYSSGYSINFSALITYLGV